MSLDFATLLSRNTRGLLHEAIGLMPNYTDLCAYYPSSTQRYWFLLEFTWPTTGIPSHTSCEILCECLCRLYPTHTHCINLLFLATSCAMTSRKHLSIHRYRVHSTYLFLSMHLECFQSAAAAKNSWLRAFRNAGGKAPRRVLRRTGSFVAMRNL